MSIEFEWIITLFSPTPSGPFASLCFASFPHSVRAFASLRFASFPYSVGPIRFSSFRFFSLLRRGIRFSSFRSCPAFAGYSKNTADIFTSKLAKYLLYFLNALTQCISIFSINMP